MLQWRLERQGDMFILDAPDGSCSFILDQASLLRLGAGCTQAALDGLDEAVEGRITCYEWVFVPYCPKCPVGPFRKKVHYLKSSKSLVTPNHRRRWPGHQLRASRRLRGRFLGAAEWNGLPIGGDDQGLKREKR